MTLRKDEALDRLARIGNVAQFAAFAPDGHGRPTFSRALDSEDNRQWGSLAQAAAHLLTTAASRSANVRTFRPGEPRGHPFEYGLRDVAEIVAKATSHMQDGLHVIINETIDVSDGGVSGVVQGDVIEFAPDDTPRCVEKPGVASLSVESGTAMLETVYGFRPELPIAPASRTEFSVHPRRQGFRQEHTILWEFEEGVPSPMHRTPRWPNNFSRMVGDKAFGLMVADGLGMRVPRTLVIGRRIAPFSFGMGTGSAESWTRTCPTEPHPGLYTTVKGWIDPFELIGREDPSGTAIASVLRQDAVPARHSGAAIILNDGRRIVEGASGEGDAFMLGDRLPERLPTNVVESVRTAFDQLEASLGPCRFEWVHDGDEVWIVQLHVGQTTSTAEMLHEGEAERWISVDVAEGLAGVRRAIKTLAPGEGIELSGPAGHTSHIADLVRREGVPTRFAPAIDGAGRRA